ncbi:unnamed protein product, partial [Menidia menidia]
ASLWADGTNPESCRGVHKKCCCHEEMHFVLMVVLCSETFQHSVLTSVMSATRQKPGGSGRVAPGSTAPSARAAAAHPHLFQDLA